MPVAVAACVAEAEPSAPPTMTTSGAIGEHVGELLGKGLVLETRNRSCACEEWSMDADVCENTGNFAFHDSPWWRMDVDGCENTGNFAFHDSPWSSTLVQVLSMLRTCSPAEFESDAEGVYKVIDEARWRRVWEQEIFQKIFQVVQKYVRALALKQPGTRALQGLIDYFDKNSPALEAMCTDLAPHSVELCKSPHGNHVLKKLVEKVRPEKQASIVEHIRCKGADVVAKDQCGCRVVERLFKHAPEHARSLMPDLDRHALKLAKSDFGNFAMQSRLRHCSARDRSELIRQLTPHTLGMTTKKTSSNVVELMLELGTPEEREAIARAFLEAESAEDALEQVAQAKFGCFPVTRLLEFGTPSIFEKISERLTPHVVELARGPGRRVVEAMLKMGSVQLRDDIARALLNAEGAHAVEEVAVDQFGCHVIRSLLALREFWISEELFKRLIPKVMQLALSHGHCVVELMLELGTADVRATIANTFLDAPHPNSLDLVAKNEFGCSVIRHLLESGRPKRVPEWGMPWISESVSRKLSPHVLELAMLKQGHRMVKVMLDLGTPEMREVIATKLLDAESPASLEQVIKNEFGCSVVGHLLKSRVPQISERVFKKLSPHVPHVPELAMLKHGHRMVELMLECGTRKEQEDIANRLLYAADPHSLEQVALNDFGRFIVGSLLELDVSWISAKVSERLDLDLARAGVRRRVEPEGGSSEVCWQ